MSGIVVYNRDKGSICVYKTLVIHKTAIEGIRIDDNKLWPVCECYRNERAKDKLREMYRMLKKDGIIEI